MARRRSTDFVTWAAYRRAWVVPLVAGLLLVVTSFRAEAPIQSTLPPTLQNETAHELLEQAREFDARFGDRQPGTPGGVDSAQWLVDRFGQVGGDLRVRTETATTTSPATNRSVGLVNVEATLPGRTRELVVVLSHRDTRANGSGGDALGQVALVELARELAATRDRRRSYLFVSTDAATLNGGGARALAARLSKRGGVVAVIALDRLAARGVLRVDATAGSGWAPPLGLVQVARDATGKEQGSLAAPALLDQVLQLAAPVTLREHGQLLARGLPAISLTRGDDQLARGSNRRPSDAASDAGAGLRAVQRMLTTFDQLDQVQTVGKTWIGSDQRIYRGWALKIFLASLLVPVWVVAVDLFVRRRRTWNLFAITGTSCRAMLAGITCVGAGWLLSAVGLLTRSEDHPPNPGAFGDARLAGVLVWMAICAAAWLLARGPDWRRARRVRTSGPDVGDLTVALMLLVLLTVATLAINPYAVVFALPTLHAWPLLISTRCHTVQRRVAAFALATSGPVLALVAIATRTDTGLGAASYAMALISTRTMPPLLALIAGAALALVLLGLWAVLGRVAYPALPALRRLAHVDQLPTVARAAKLMVRRQHRDRAEQPLRASARSAQRTSQAQRDYERRERARARAARTRVRNR